MSKKDIITVSPPTSATAYEREFKKELYKITEKCFKDFLKVANSFMPRTLDKKEEITTPIQLQNALKPIIVKWNKYLNKYAPMLVERLQRKLRKYVDKKFNVYGIKFDIESLGLKQEMDAHGIETMELIKTIPKDVVRRITPIVMNSLQAGDREEITKQIMKTKAVGLRRAKFIARDQVAKNLEGINTGRARQIGLEYYIWDTMEDERVSTGYGGHKQLNGLIFKWDKPEAVINGYNGEIGHPKQRPNCRCRRRWIFLKPGQKMKKISLGYKIVNENNQTLSAPAGLKKL